VSDGKKMNRVVRVAEIGSGGGREARLWRLTGVKKDGAVDSCPVRGPRPNDGYGVRLT